VQILKASNISKMAGLRSHDDGHCTLLLLLLLLLSGVVVALGHSTSS
jgi:hypothetical protein